MTIGRAVELCWSCIDMTWELDRCKIIAGLVLYYVELFRFSISNPLLLVPDAQRETINAMSRL